MADRGPGKQSRGSSGPQEPLLEGKYELTEADKEKLTWKKLTCENTGLANLARVQGLQTGKNTAFARMVIESDRDQVKRIEFGFSDDVRAYFNDRLVYGGSNIYPETIGFWALLAYSMTCTFG